MEIGNIRESSPRFDNEMALSIKKWQLKGIKNEEIDSLLSGNQLVL